MKIVVLDGYALNPGDLSWESFNKLGDLKVYVRTQKEDVIDRIGDAEIVITNKTIIDRNIIENTNIKYIGIFATGYNVVDIDACREKGITVCNVPEYSTDSVVQLTFALLLEIMSKPYIHNISVKEGKWAQSIDFSYTVAPMAELRGKTIGLIGYGSIGKGTAKVANAFNLKVLYNKPSGKCDNDTDMCRYADIDELFEKSDIISLHCPLTTLTEKIINKENISKMKHGVIIINTARGGVVDENDLADALNSGKVGAYGCDVLSSEPPEKDNKIISAKNTIITPHIAWQAYETRERLMSIAAKNLRNFIEGNPCNVVS